MKFYELVAHDHLKDVLDAYKMDKITFEVALKKIKKCSKYIAYNERNTRSKKQNHSTSAEVD